jgi:hypothetical protein
LAAADGAGSDFLDSLLVLEPASDAVAAELSDFSDLADLEDSLEAWAAFSFARRLVP